MAIGDIGEVSGPWEGLFSGIADLIWLMAGTLMTRVDGAHSAGVSTLTVESTHDFPDEGRIYVADTLYYYTSKTTTTLVGITIDPLIVSGLAEDVLSRSVVSDVSGQQTQLGDLRASFLVEEAEDRELDIMGRNYGIPRPRGLPDALWRPLLQAMMFIEAQTMYSLEQVLDIMFGVGNYTLYEDLETFPHTVFVLVPTGGGDQFEGKSWLVGGEEQMRGTPTTDVDVDNPPRVVYGIYEHDDFSRTGTNYANLDIAYTTSDVFRERLTTAALWLDSDVGKPVIIDQFPVTTHWKIGSVVDASNVNLRWDSQIDGTADGASPLRFTTDTDWFPPWLAAGQGVDARLVIEAGPNSGEYSITDRISSKEIECSLAAFVSDTDMTWYIKPFFGIGGGTASLPRATFSGVTITAPNVLPLGPGAIDVLVDYTHVPSAQAMLSASVNGDSQYPFYLWDDGALARLILDLLTAAGVQVLTETE